jgi:ElaB/YqjD/DUF883 family membrane-anchored ribosome-binding protein
MDNESEVILEQMEGTRANLAQKLETLENQVVETLQEATSSVSETVQQVKDVVSDTVETVKDTVEGTVESVRDTVQGTVDTMKETFDLRRQVENHPWLMFGGACALGLVAGQLLRPYLRRLHWEGGPQAGRQYPGPYGYMDPYSSYTGTAENVAAFPPPSAEVRREEPAPRQEAQAHQPGLLENLGSLLAPELSKFKGVAIGAALGMVRDYIKQSAPPEIGHQVADMVDSITTRVGGDVFQEPVLQMFTGERPQQSHDADGGGERSPAAHHAYGTAANH